MADPTIEDAFVSVCQAYDNITTDNEEGNRQLSEIGKHLRSSYAAVPRILTQAASDCIDKYIAAELDFSTPGMRGLGRISDALPRLAAKHRRIISHMDERSRENLRYAIKKHIICGYLFAEWFHDLKRDDKREVETEELFKMWAPAIYTVNIDPETKNDAEIQLVWIRATAQDIHDVLIAAGGNWDLGEGMDTEVTIVSSYHIAGMILRLLEDRPLTRKKQLNVASTAHFSKNTNENALNLTEEEIKYLSAIRAKWRELEMMQLQDLIVNCQNKFQFAKTYMVYGWDNERNSNKVRAAANHGDYQFLALLGIPPHLYTRKMLEAVIHVSTQIIEEKRSMAAAHFYAKWNKPITNYTSKGKGCAVLVLAIFLFVCFLTFAK